MSSPAIVSDADGVSAILQDMVYNSMFARGDDYVFVDTSELTFPKGKLRVGLNLVGNKDTVWTELEPDGVKLSFIGPGASPSPSALHRKILTARSLAGSTGADARVREATIEFEDVIRDPYVPNGTKSIRISTCRGAPGEVTWCWIDIGGARNSGENAKMFFDGAVKLRVSFDKHTRFILASRQENHKDFGK